MVKSRKQTEEEPRRTPNLLVPKASAEAKIRTQIDKGEALLNVKVGSESDPQALRDSNSQWTDYNKELLVALFDTSDICSEYSKFQGGVTSARPSFSQKIGYVHRSITRSLTRLRSVLGRFDLFGETSQSSVLETNGLHGLQVSDQVFVVHGHDETLKVSAIRLLEQLSLSPIVLHEQPNGGRTIIEKFEDYSDVAFALVLLTPDDEGRSKQAKVEDLEDRARQNVVFELGYFIGKLGRKKVCALHLDSVEIPSDMSGVIYIPVDEGGAWKYNVAKELEAIGFSVDLNVIS